MYKFDEKEHIHLLDDKPLIGVTTALSIIAKPALIQWSANMAVDYISNNFPSFQEMVKNPLALTDLLKSAKVAHRLKKEKAGDWGSVVHKKIEAWIKTGKVYSIAPILKVLEKKEGKVIVLNDDEKKVVSLVFTKFMNWVKENKVVFLESEKHVWSEKLWIGGILDLVFTMDGKKYIGDIKTANAIYNEAFFQMGAYNLCLEEMGEHKEVEGYVVINLKKDGNIDFKKADNMQINREAFLSALSLYKITQSLK